MALPLIGTFIDAGMKVLDRVLPDPQAKREAQLELLKLQQAGEFKEIELQMQRDLAQAQINQAEAASPNAFVSGWRPFIGWICGSIFVVNYMLIPLIAWVSPALNLAPPPRLEIGEVMPVLLGMLGLGGMRTFEKISKVAAK